MKYITCYGNECSGCVHCEGAEYISDIAFYISDRIQNDKDGIENMSEIIYDMLIKMLIPRKVKIIE